MASLLGAQEKTRGFWAGSRLVLWLWCTLLSGVVRQATACQGVRQLGLEVQPTGVTKIRLGDALDLRCVTTDGCSTTDDIEFRIGERFVPSEKINITTRRLYIDKPDSGIYSYFCFNKKTKKYCTSRVIVSAPPTDVADFTCISYNLEELNCSWTNSNKIVHTNYSLVTVINGLRTNICEAQQIGFNRFSCILSTYGVPIYRQLEKVLNFILSSSNVFGKVEQNFTIDHYSVVKPAPVEGLKILGVGSHSVQLQWKIPLNMIDLLPVGIKHKIEYRVSNVKMALERFLSVDTSSLPLHNSTYTVLLSELPHAHMQYEVRIYIRPATTTGEEYWSDYRSVFCYVGGFRRKVNASNGGSVDRSTMDPPSVTIAANSTSARAPTTFSSLAPAPADVTRADFIDNSSSVNSAHRLSEATTQLLHTQPNYSTELLNHRYNFLMFLAVIFCLKSF